MDLVEGKAAIIQTGINMNRKDDLVSILRGCWGQELLDYYLYFHLCLGFTDNDLKKIEYPVSGNAMGENALMLKVTSLKEFKVNSSNNHQLHQCLHIIE